jgi:hypothetical protein
VQQRVRSASASDVQLELVIDEIAEQTQRSDEV